ncbi:MAG TPA: ComF family protein [Candidatus Kapabacteria bacterium]
MLSFFLPQKCIHCDAPSGKHAKSDSDLKKYLCANCFRQFQLMSQPSSTDIENKQQLFSGFNTELVFYTPFPFIAEDITQSIIHHFKYADMPNLAVITGRELTARLTKMEYDVIVPIPLHGTRLGERGYNQSEKLAEGISSVLNIPIAKKHLVKRTRQTPSQTGLTLEERQKNMEGAFALTDKGKEALREKRILLVDDVMTTGATMASATEALIKAEPTKVGILAFTTVIGDTTSVKSI